MWNSPHFSRFLSLEKLYDPRSELDYNLPSAENWEVSTGTRLDWNCDQSKCPKTGFCNYLHRHDAGYSRKVRQSPQVAKVPGGLVYIAGLHLAIRLLLHHRAAFFLTHQATNPHSRHEDNLLREKSNVRVSAAARDAFPLPRTGCANVSHRLSRQTIVRKTRVTGHQRINPISNTPTGIPAIPTWVLPRNSELCIARVVDHWRTAPIPDSRRNREVRLSSSGSSTWWAEWNYGVWPPRVTDEHFLIHRHVHYTRGRPPASGCGCCQAVRLLNVVYVSESWRPGFYLGGVALRCWSLSLSRSVSVIRLLLPAFFSPQLYVSLSLSLSLTRTSRVPMSAFAPLQRVCITKRADSGGELELEHIRDRELVYASASTTWQLHCSCAPLRRIGASPQRRLNTWPWPDLIQVGTSSRLYNLICDATGKKGNLFRSSSSSKWHWRNRCAVKIRVTIEISIDLSHARLHVVGQLFYC